MLDVTAVALTWGPKVADMLLEPAGGATTLNGAFCKVATDAKSISAE